MYSRLSVGRVLLPTREVMPARSPLPEVGSTTWAPTCSRQGDCLKLSMSRADIANYLGLAVETVSRALGRMEESGLLLASGRTLRVVDHAALAALAGAVAKPSREKLRDVRKCA